MPEKRVPPEGGTVTPSTHGRRAKGIIGFAGQKLKGNFLNVVNGSNEVRFVALMRAGRFLESDLNKLACRYAILRFLPYTETGEFANVGVVLACPATGYFGFKLETRRYAFTALIHPREAILRFGDARVTTISRSDSHLYK